MAGRYMSEVHVAYAIIIILSLMSKLSFTVAKPEDRSWSISAAFINISSNFDVCQQVWLKLLLLQMTQ